MSADVPLFSHANIPHHQKRYGGMAFPAVLSPAAAAVHDYKPSDFPAAVKDQKAWLDCLLHTHGAILFRGFNSRATASDFNDVVEAFGYDELPYVGSAALRTNVVGRVFTANDSPPDQIISFHHEMAQVPDFPLKLFFFCEVEPARGGETPIVLSHIVYERMKEKHPEFVEKLEEHGVIYTRVLGEDDDPYSSVGRGWKSTFLTDDKKVAEERAAKLNMKVEWTDDGAKTTIGPTPPIRYDKSRQRKIWFNIIVSAYTGWDDKWNHPKKAVKFGDGSPLPEHIVVDCLKIMEEESVAIPWKKGDILLIDNLAVLHARNPFTPPRRVLASLCK